MGSPPGTLVCEFIARTLVQCFDLLFLVFHRLWLLWIIFFHMSWTLFQMEKRKKETEVSWVSIVKIERLILEFHVNFNRNRVCDTRFARVNSSSSAERC